MSRIILLVLSNLLSVFISNRCTCSTLLLNGPDKNQLRFCLFVIRYNVRMERSECTENRRSWGRNQSLDRTRHAKGRKGRKGRGDFNDFLFRVKNWGAPHVAPGALWHNLHIVQPGKWIPGWRLWRIRRPILGPTPIKRSENMVSIK